MRNIVSDDDSLTPGVLPALREYNLAQFATTQVPGHQHSVRLLSLSALGLTQLLINDAMGCAVHHQ